MSGSCGRARRSRNAGVAATEFALVAPFFVAIIVAITDFTMVYHQQLQLGSVLAAAAEYGFSQGQTLSGSTLTTAITTFISAVTPITLHTVSASYNNSDASGCYCVSGSPAAFTGPLTCGATCTDGSGSTAGQYIVISASFSYAALFPPDQAMFASSYSQTVLARLK
jgi:Flp pilus assembly protein TadG